MVMIRYDEDDLDAVAAETYNERARSPFEMSPEHWARIKERFPQSARECLEHAKQEMGED